jgi:hypothetical protein
MNQVIDNNGALIRGLYKKADGSLVVNDPQAFNQKKLHHETISSLNNEVATLKEQVKQILEHINGKH